MLALLVVPGSARAQDFLLGLEREPVGYGIYRGTVYELGYTLELAPWMTADGRSPAFLSGMAFTEHRGGFINLITTALMIIGVVQSTGHYERVGSSIYRVITDAEAAQAQRNIENIAAVSNEKFFTMRLRAYHESLGSQADGLRADVGVGSSLGDGPVPWGAFYVGLYGGWLRSNANWDTNDGLRLAFEHGYFGAVGQFHVSPVHFLGFFTRATLGFGSRPIALIELGADIHVGNRFFLSGSATLDLTRPEHLPDALGARGDVGVRF